MNEFFTAALPWGCMGLMLAVFFVYSAKTKNDEFTKKRLELLKALCYTFRAYELNNRKD